MVNFPRRTMLKMSALAAVGVAVAPGAGFAQNAVSKAGAVPANGDYGKGTKLILLGTKGGPLIGGRSNPANMLMINGVPYVIDCGMGVTHQIVDAKVDPKDIKYVFITHHHSDHNLEYGNLLYNSWVMGRKHVIEAFGPLGIEMITETYWKMNQIDIETRMADEGRPEPSKLVVAKNINENTVVLKNEDVTVRSFRTPHPMVLNNFAYRFEARDRTIVFSSDTAYNPKLAEFAKGADVLVHESMYGPGVDLEASRNPNGETIKKHLLESHTLTEDVGKVAAAAGVKTLVMNHFVPGGDSNITDEMWAEGVRKSYKGEIIVGKDLMVI